MRHALDLAQARRGYVEPNPMVGAVLVDADLNWLAEGAHEQFGGPHAEVNALRRAEHFPPDTTLYVTLEPCHHQGKTPPCVDAILGAKIPRVVIGTPDPAPHPGSSGIDRLREAGVEVVVGTLQQECRRLIRPFAKTCLTGLPYVHAKWAMTLDGKIASKSGSSQWISGAKSRQKVHRLRGLMDGIIVGKGTAIADDPLLTARPPGPRTAARIVFDSALGLDLECQLTQTLDQAPVILVCREGLSEERKEPFRQRGITLIEAPADETGRPELLEALKQFNQLGMTNVLVEGGSHLLGRFFDGQQIDEVQAFIAPRLIGGDGAPAPIAGLGFDSMEAAITLSDVTVTPYDQDCCVQGIIKHDYDRTSA